MTYRDMAVRVWVCPKCNTPNDPTQQEPTLPHRQCIMCDKVDCGNSNCPRDVPHSIELRVGSITGGYHIQFYTLCEHDYNQVLQLLRCKDKPNEHL